MANYYPFIGYNWLQPRIMAHGQSPRLISWISGRYPAIINRWLSMAMRCNAILKRSGGFFWVCCWSPGNLTNTNQGRDLWELATVVRGLEGSGAWPRNQPLNSAATTEWLEPLFLWARDSPWSWWQRSQTCRFFAMIFCTNCSSSMFITHFYLFWILDVNNP